MVVTRMINYEIYDDIGEDTITNALDSYAIGIGDDGDTITFYDLDDKNQIIFLEEFQKQLDTEIAERIALLKS